MGVENQGFSANHWSNVSFELHVTSGIYETKHIFLKVYLVWGSVVLPCFPATRRINKCQALEVCFAKLNIQLSGCAFTGRRDNLGENRFTSYDLVDLHFPLAYLST